MFKLANRYASQPSMGGGNLVLGGDPLTSMGGMGMGLNKKLPQKPNPLAQLAPTPQPGADTQGIQMAAQQAMKQAMLGNQEAQNRTIRGVLISLGYRIKSASAVMNGGPARSANRNLGTSGASGASSKSMGRNLGTSSSGVSAPSTQTPTMGATPMMNNMGAGVAGGVRGAAGNVAGGMGGTGGMPGPGVSAQPLYSRLPFGHIKTSFLISGNKDLTKLAMGGPMPPPGPGSAAGNSALPPGAPPPAAPLPPGMAPPMGAPPMGAPPMGGAPMPPGAPPAPPPQPGVPPAPGMPPQGQPVPGTSPPDPPPAPPQHRRQNIRSSVMRLVRMKNMKPQTSADSREDLKHQQMALGKMGFDLSLLKEAAIPNWLAKLVVHGSSLVNMGQDMMPGNLDMVDPPGSPVMGKRTPSLPGNRTPLGQMPVSGAVSPSGIGQTLGNLSRRMRVRGLKIGTDLNTGIDIPLQPRGVDIKTGGPVPPGGNTPGPASIGSPVVAQPTGDHLSKQANIGKLLMSGLKGLGRSAPGAIAGGTLGGVGAGAASDFDPRTTAMGVIGGGLAGGMGHAGMNRMRGAAPMMARGTRGMVPMTPLGKPTPLPTMQPRTPYIPPIPKQGPPPLPKQGPPTLPYQGKPEVRMPREFLTKPHLAANHVHQQLLSMGVPKIQAEQAARKLHAKLMGQTGTREINQAGQIVPRVPPGQAAGPTSSHRVYPPNYQPVMPGHKPPMAVPMNQPGGNAPMALRPGVDHVPTRLLPQGLPVDKLGMDALSEKLSRDRILFLEDFLKSGSQDNSKPQRSSTGESDGLAYQHKPDHYMQGQDAWKSVNGYFKGSKYLKRDPNPFLGKHSGSEKRALVSLLGKAVRTGIPAVASGLGTAALHGLGLGGSGLAGLARATGTGAMSAGKKALGLFESPHHVGEKALKSFTGPLTPEMAKEIREKAFNKQLDTQIGTGVLGTGGLGSYLGLNSLASGESDKPSVPTYALRKILQGGRSVYNTLKDAMDKKGIFPGSSFVLPPAGAAIGGAVDGPHGAMVGGGAGAGVAAAGFVPLLAGLLVPSIRKKLLSATQSSRDKIMPALTGGKALDLIKAVGSTAGKGISTAMKDKKMLGVTGAGVGVGGTLGGLAGDQAYTTIKNSSDFQAQQAVKKPSPGSSRGSGSPKPAKTPTQGTQRPPRAPQTQQQPAPRVPQAPQPPQPTQPAPQGPQQAPAPQAPQPAQPPQAPPAQQAPQAPKAPKPPNVGGFQQVPTPQSSMGQPQMPQQAVAVPVPVPVPTRAPSVREMVDYGQPQIQKQLTQGAQQPGMNSQTQQQVTQQSSPAMPKQTQTAPMSPQAQTLAQPSQGAQPKTAEFAEFLLEGALLEKMANNNRLLR